jgi:D-beta-D-heptose 7-phosphate kinase/D-beta-D-heptose 1-phosphate adenosyltransferase
MLDRYYEGPTERVSPEAPVPIVRIEDTFDRPGGAANVAVNIASLGAPVTLLGFIGNDKDGETLSVLLNQLGIETCLLNADGFGTITKLRVLSQRQQVIRLDFEKRHASLDTRALNEVFERVIIDHRLVVFSDYGKGALTEIKVLLQKCRAHGLRALVDPKGRDYERYRGAYILTPNTGEFFAVAGEPENEVDFDRRAEKLRAEIDIDALLVTRSERGMSLFEEGKAPIHVPAETVEIFDVTGAGDTVIATLAVALGAKMPPSEAVWLANRAAAAVVKHKGTAAPTLQDLSDTAPNLWTFDECHTLTLIERARQRGEKIVMTNGCFDVLHAGHVDYLRRAKALGHRLVVAVNSDASVARLKGPGRPVNSLEHRLAVLAALRSVDWLIPFDGSIDETGRRVDTPLELIKRVRPDVLVKGGDYQKDEIVGAQEVTATGGEVRTLPTVPGLSTTELLLRMSDYK